VGSVCRRIAGPGLVYFLLVRVVPMSIILMLASTLAILGVLLFLLAWRARSKTGIPSGEIFYQDLMGQPFQGGVLRSARWGISGKPDCLIRTPEGVVPVELKKSKKASRSGRDICKSQNPEPCVLRARRRSDAGTCSLWSRDLCWSTGAACRIAENFSSPPHHSLTQGRTLNSEPMHVDLPALSRRWQSLH
jgi:hypothetical protein